MHLSRLLSYPKPPKSKRLLWNSSILQLYKSQRLNSHMLYSCICAGFHHEDDEPCSSSPVSTRVEPKPKGKNPYSSRGLDRYSQLLADLDDRRQKIYSQIGSRDISLVRFMFTSSNDCVPIVIKMRRKGQKSKSCELTKGKHATAHQSGELDKNIETRVHRKSSVTAKGVKVQKVEHDHKPTVKRNLSWNMKLINKLRRPSYYVPVVLILILLMLTVCGRSAAAICTSLSWYLVPLPEDSSYSGASKASRKKCARRLSGKKMTANVSFQKNDHPWPSKQNSPRELRHQRPGEYFKSLCLFTDCS